MQSYDKAYDLARDMKQSEAYAQYVEAKEQAFSDDLNKQLYQKYLQLSRSLQAAQMAGQEPTEQQMEEYHKLWGILSLNDKLQRFMLCEHRVNQMLSDVFRILADAVDLDLSFLE